MRFSGFFTGLQDFFPGKNKSFSWLPCFSPALPGAWILDGTVVPCDFAIHLTGAKFLNFPAHPNGLDDISKEIHVPQLGAIWADPKDRHKFTRTLAQKNLRSEQVNPQSNTNHEYPCQQQEIARTFFMIFFH